MNTCRRASRSRVRADGSKSTAFLSCRAVLRKRRTVRSAMSRRMVSGQPFLVGVVVAALEVPAQVVAHDRGHLVAAQGVEPREVVDRPAVRGVRRHELVGAGQPGHLAADAGEVGAVGEDQEPAELDPGVADAPDLPVDERGRLGAVGRSGCRAGSRRGPASGPPPPAPSPASRWCRRSASGTRSGGHGRHRAGPAGELVERRQRRRVDRHLVEGYVVQGRQRSRRRAASGPRPAPAPPRGRRAPARGTRPRPAASRTRPARSRRWRRSRARARRSAPARR